MDKSSQSVLSNLIWRFMERCGSQLISFVVSVVLARLLAPELYGSIALVTVITSILQVFVDSGMANALIQKKDTDDLDYSSVFYFNLVFCLVLYLGLFLAAPFIARVYEDGSLVPVIRVLGLTLVVSGVKNVQQAYVSKTMQFRRFFFATLGGTLFSAVVGISMAYMGYGIWALVMQQLLNAAVNTAILWLTVGWKPRLAFSFTRLAGLISYGWKLLVSALLDTVYNKLYQLVVGIVYSSADLAYYNKAELMRPDYCFPNRLEEVVILQHAILHHPEGAKAPYYLGNFWYNARQYDDAIACWEFSASKDSSFPTVWRNLSLAYYNKRHDAGKAKEALEKAFGLDPTDARILMELDQLYKKLQYSHKQRLEFLEQHLSLVEQRDDLCIERASIIKKQFFLTTFDMHPES